MQYSCNIAEWLHNIATNLQIFQNVAATLHAGWEVSCYFEYHVTLNIMNIN